MDTLTHGPYEWQRPKEGRSGPKLLLVASLFATVGVLVGIFALPAEGPREETPPLPVTGVSQLIYPASLVREIAQPAEGEWLLPSSVFTLSGATFVLDTGNDRILKLDQAGRVLATFDSASSNGPTLREPMAMTSDGRNLYIANSLAAEVLVLDLSGRVVRILPLQPGGADEMVPRPIGVAVASDGGIVISDANNHRVVRLDDEGGVIWSVGTGTRAGGSDGFNVPGNLTLDSDGNIYVVDTLNGRVVRLSPDGTFVRQFGRLGDTAGTLSRPKGVAVDAEGRVFVSDGLLAAVQVFSPDGTYLGVIGRRDPTDPASDSLFQAPAALWLTGDRLYVMDRVAGLITLRLLGPPVAEASTHDEEGG